MVPEFFVEDAAFDDLVDDGGDVPNFDGVGEAQFFDQRESMAVDGGDDESFFVVEIAKRSAVGPLFAFAVAGGDVGKDDAFFAGGGVQNVDKVGTGFVFVVVINANERGVGVKKTGPAGLLPSGGVAVETVGDDGDKHKTS